MVTALLIALAAADPAPVERIDYALPPPPPPRVTGAGCAGSPGEILVCGRRGQGDRLGELGPPPGDPPRQGVVGVDLPFGRVEPEITKVVRQDGHVDTRVMVKLKIPF
ncbi:MAG TPA: hypothetical protein VEZ70_03585 [Allosphingosinicella sp.]|nr:hypothetical protein [Allosphingosinicella sp.]